MFSHELVVLVSILSTRIKEWPINGFGGEQMGGIYAARPVGIKL